MKSLWMLIFFLPWLAQATVLGTDLFTGQARQIDPGPQGTVVVFLSAKCPCSASHVGEIKSIAQTYKNFQFVGVHANSNEGKSESQEYFKKTELPFPVLRDRDGKLANEFRASKTPHVFVIDPAGKVLYRGGVTDSKNCDNSGRNYLREALSDLAGGQKVRTAEARTLGCAISRGDKSDW